MSKHHPLIVGFFLAVFSFLYCGLLLSGMRPLEMDMMNIVYASHEIPAKTFLGWILSPQSQAVYEDGWSNIIPVRMVQPFIFKILYAFFQDSHTPYLVYRLIVMVILALALYAMAYRLSKNVLLSLLCSLFVVVNPGSGASMVELWDTETLGQMFMVLALLCFLHILDSMFEGEEKRLRWKSFAGLLALFFLCGMLSVKSKDTGKLMVPGILWGFLVFTLLFHRYFGTTKLKWDLRLNLLLGTCIWISLPLVWVKRIGIAPVEFHPFDIAKILFWNTRGWEPESMISFFRLHRHLPCSVLASFGFFLSWVLLLLLVGLIFQMREKVHEGNAGEARRTLLLLGLWLLFCLPIFIVRPGLHLPRYLILPLIPCALFFACAVQLVLEKRSTALFRMCKALIVLLMLFQIADNMRHSIYFRNELPAIWIKQYKMREAMFKDVSGQEKVSPLALHRFFVQAQYPIEVMDLVYPHERKDPFLDPSFQNLLNRRKILYVASTNPLPDHPGKTLVCRMDALGNDPYSLLMKKFSHHTGSEQLYLYRVKKE